MATDKVQALIAALETINSTLKYRVPGARSLPEKLRRFATESRISSGSLYGEEALATNMAELVLERFADEAEARGVAVRRQRLMAASVTIDQLRVQLPHLAAALAVELGAVVRDLREEANDGQ